MRLSLIGTISLIIFPEQLRREYHDSARSRLASCIDNPPQIRIQLPRGVPKLVGKFYLLGDVQDGMIAICDDVDPKVIISRHFLTLRDSSTSLGMTILETRETKTKSWTNSTAACRTSNSNRGRAISRHRANAGFLWNLKSPRADTIRGGCCPIRRCR